MIVAEGNPYKKRCVSNVNSLPSSESNPIGAWLYVVMSLRGEGWSYEEIANKTGLAIGTVRSRIHYARKRAKELAQQSI